ncbi:TraB/GumN family protein [Clostridium gasigenes]|uniref:TraB/GumN family protein n=1 Tax=Clostridium gasigenes TaxID=94869 RepID=A0A7X0SAZ0_9CLOT|nr:TraB/GumN family protein [Clostridium gasigenes]MBB6714229.1 TraB/GumN family protein [Clostridium gasigenes]
MESEVKKYQMVNIMKFICAILVITIHTSVFRSLGEGANATLSLVIARIAVPFFFIAAGYFFYMKMGSREGYLKGYIKKLLIIYVIFNSLYLVLLFQTATSMINGGFGYLKAIYANGFALSLWYFPALILSISFVYLFLKKNWIRPLIGISIILFAVGLMGDSYFGLIQGTPLEAIVNAYKFIFDATRNGLCIGVPFITIGALINKYSLDVKVKKPIIFIAIFSLILGFEAYTLIINKIPADYNIYISLALLVPFIFIWALKCKINISDRNSNLFRDMSLWIYCVHELIMMSMFRYTRFLGMNSVVNFIVVALLSVCVAYFIANRRVKPEVTNKKKELTFAIGSLALAMLFIFVGVKLNSAPQGEGNPYVINVADDAPTSNIVGLLWKISDEDSNMYLYGNSMIGTKDMYPLAPVVEEAFKNSEGLLIQFNDAGLDGEKLRKIMMYEEGDSLDKHITPEAMKIMEEKVEEQGGDIDQYKKIKSIVGSQIIMASNINNDKYSLVYGIDAYLSYRAKQQKKPIIGMDDIYECCIVDNNVSNEVEDASVKLMQYNDRMSEKYLEGLDAWKTGDLQKVKECLENPYTVSEEEKENLNKLTEIIRVNDKIILTNQNKLYESKIDQYMKDNKNYFISMSVDYILGKDGIAKMLEDKGYKVERIEN